MVEAGGVSCSTALLPLLVPVSPAPESFSKGTQNILENTEYHRVQYSWEGEAAENVENFEGGFSKTHV